MIIIVDGAANDSFGGDRGEGCGGEYSSGRSILNTEEENSFDNLLKQAQEKIRNRKPWHTLLLIVWFT